jgi:outer membrane lipoprotein-sorting protein
MSGWIRIAVAVFPAFLCDQLCAQSNDLLTKIWNGVQQAQTKNTSGCGKITETRTSKLLVKPLVFHGTFCAEGLDRFALEYSEPDPIRIRFNGDYLNVTTGGGKNTEVIEVGTNVRRTQAYFSKENSIENLKKNFAIEAREAGGVYILTLAPRSGRFGNTLNHIVVQVGKEDFLLRSLEVDGKNGVDSVFQIEITSVNTKIPPSMFEVYRPK